MAFGAPGLINTGTDQTLSITCPNQSIAPLIVSLDGRRERFQSSYDDHLITDEPCDNGGVIDIVRIPGTVTGTFEMARQNDNFGAVIAALDQAFYNGQADTGFTIQSTEPSRDGVSGTAVYQYVNVHFHGYEPGDWTRNAKTKCSVKFTASLRNKLQ